MHCACAILHELLYALSSDQRPKLIIEADVSVHFCALPVCRVLSGEFCTYHILETTEVNTIEL